MGQAGARSAKKSFIRQVLTQWQETQDKNNLIFRTQNGMLTNDPSEAYYGPIMEQHAAYLQNMGFEPYNMPVKLTGKVDVGVPSVRGDVRYFVMLCLGMYATPGGSQLMYYSFNGPVADPEQAHIFGNHREAYNVWQTVFPNKPINQDGVRYAGPDISLVGVSLNNWSGMKLDKGSGKWHGIPTKK